LFITRLGLAGLQLTLGLGLGLALLEAILHANPGLLLRGMAVPTPIDPPLTVKVYDIHYSDADEIFWRPDLIKPLPPEADRLEARVTFATDEFGFRNPPPVPPVVEVVVLGRSYSLGAQVTTPWPRLLAQSTHWTVLNLSEPGSGLDVKTDYLHRFGLPHHPRWVIVEVIPAIDIPDSAPAPPLLISYLPAAFIQNFWRAVTHQGVTQPASQPVYPLRVNLPGRQIDFTCCLHYLDFLLLDQATILNSPAWAAYTPPLIQLVDEARAASACVALLYQPMKPDVYFPLVTDPAQLEPTLLGLEATSPSKAEAPVLIRTLQANALVGRDALATFASQHHLIFIDPSERLRQAILQGTDPFMVYDSHLNAVGHQLIAQTAAEALSSGDCP
jgi:hypothetical protein